MTASQYALKGPTDDKLDPIRDRLAREVADIATRHEFTQEAKRARVAAAYVQAQDEANRVIGAEDAAFDADTARLRQKYATRPAGYDVIAYRDAEDRLDQIASDRLGAIGPNPDVEAQAVRQLERALSSNDEGRVRAVIAASLEHGWADVVTALQVARPGDADDLERLWAATQLADDRRELYRQERAFIPLPTELHGLGYVNIRDLATGAAA